MILSSSLQLQQQEIKPPGWKKHHSSSETDIEDYPSSAEPTNSSKKAKSKIIR